MEFDCRAGEDWVKVGLGESCVQGDMTGCEDGID